MRYLLKPGMACGIWLVLQTWLFAQPPATLDYLLLKNGAVLTGRVVQEGQTYIVRSLSNGGESRYPSSMVAKLCGNAQEVYTILKKYSIEDDAGDHCRLAKFCLTHKLMKEAKAEIDDAFKYERRSPEAQILLKQWASSQQASKTPPAEIPTLPSSAVPLLPSAMLEEWPVAMTPAAFQDFSQRVQPLLQTGCGTGACHGVTEGKRAFILRRGLVGVPASPVMSKINLERVLGLVDKETPEASELIRRAMSPHGPVKIWPVTQEQTTLLRQWVMYITGKQELVKQAEVANKAAAKSSNEFASGSTPAPVGSNPATGDTANKLPVIPGMSGSAIQQTGGTVENKPPQETQQQPPAGGSSILPPIPGVSGKAQGGGGNQTPPPQKPAQREPMAERPAKDSVKDQAAMLEYARRMGVVPLMPAPKDPIPERLHIVNAGTYRVEAPPTGEMFEELRDMLKKHEEAKKSDSKETGNSSASFMRTGTVVSSPPK